MRHWRVVEIFEKEKMVYLDSPSMIRDTAGTLVFNAFKERRQLYVQFRELEKMIENKGMNGWILVTEMDRPKVMKLIVRCGGQPYHIDLRSEVIWFCKYFKED